jgi:hypothetical protein
MFKAGTQTELKAIAGDRIGAHHMLLTLGARLGPYTIESLMAPEAWARSTRPTMDD